LCALDPHGNFPTPRRLLDFSESRLASKTASGYRARTIRTVARLFAQEKLPLDQWAAAREFERIAEALEPIWGIGPYALSHILVLLGDYRTIPVDSEILKYLSKTHFNGRKVTPKRAVEPYERFGAYRYLAFKFARMSRRENYIN
jgi:3-methyladenine DNA glycosylase/8-oxoguanine DNA glycosylase